MTPGRTWRDLTLDPRVQGVFLFLLASAFFLTRLGQHGMANYDDCFYAQKAKEMFASGTWWHPTFNGVPSFDNPPFYFWLVVLSYKVFGVTVFAAQFPSACMGVLSVLAVFILGNRFFGRPVGFFSGLVLTTTLPFAKYARHAMVDVTLSLLVCLALWAFWEAVQRDRRFFLLWGLSCGAAVLTKSVLGLFPALIGVVWLFFSGRGREARSPWFLGGVLLAVAAGGSWYLAEFLAHGEDFLQRHFGWLILKRGFGSSEGPWWGPLSYLKDLATFYWPWLPFLGLALARSSKKNERERPEVQLVLLWAGVIFLVMSLMDKKALWYVLPAYPALALLTGHFLGNSLRGAWGRVVQTWTLGVGALAILWVVLAPIPLDREREKSVRDLAPLVREAADQGADLYCFHGNFHGLNNALLFFSDKAVPKEAFLRETSQARKVLAGKEWVLCLVYRKDFEELTQGMKGWFLWKETQDLYLISNRNRGNGS